MGSRVYGGVAACAGTDPNDRFNEYNDFMTLDGLSFCERNQHFYYDLLFDTEFITDLWWGNNILDTCDYYRVPPLMERTKKLGYP